MTVEDAEKDGAFVGEVVVGGGRADPRLTRHRPQGQGAGAFTLKDADRGVDQRAAQVTMMIGAGIGNSGGAH